MYEWKKSMTVLPFGLFGLWVRGVPHGNLPNTASWQRVLLKSFFLLKLSKWMVLTMTNIGASVHYGSSQSIIAIKNLTKLFKSEKTLCMLLRAVNSNQTIKHKVNSANITSPPKRGCMEESTPVHWNITWVLRLATLLVSCFSLVQIMVLWKSISK